MQGTTSNRGLRVLVTIGMKRGHGQWDVPTTQQGRACFSRTGVQWETSLPQMDFGGCMQVTTSNRAPWAWATTEMGFLQHGTCLQHRWRASRSQLVVPNIVLVAWCASSGDGRC
ncbi:unnamed protein product [Heterosigma akashiwo]